jgi:hypothetical protein
LELATYPPVGETQFAANERSGTSTHKPFFMIRFALIALAVQANLFVIAQNLVPNPSFEEYIECPQGTGEFDIQVVNWESWQESPDIFQVCNNSGLGTAGIPENAWGVQEAITGNAYAGLFTFVSYFENGREYIAAQLLNSLTQGEDYYVMFYTSRTDSSEGMVERRCATNNIGLRFFKDPAYSVFPPVSNPFEPDNFVHINANDLIEDDQNWTLVDGWFTADDDYNWVALGNFFTDEYTAIQSFPGSELGSGVYYIENVCVATSPEECEYLMNIEHQVDEVRIGTFPNPTNGFVTLQLPVGISFDVDLHSSAGQLVFSANRAMNGQRLDLAHLDKGVYVLRVYNTITFKTLKLVLQ